MENVYPYAAPTSYHYCGAYGEHAKNTTHLNTELPDQLLAPRDLPGVPSICVATSYSGMVVEPNGDLKKCWAEVGESHSYGNIVDGELPTLDEVSPWLDWDPYRPGSQCYDCKMLPTCGGGCPLPWIRGEPVKCRFYSENEFSRFIEASYKLRKSSSAHIGRNEDATWPAVLLP